jgi:hypothetical protein
LDLHINDLGPSPSRTVQKLAFPLGTHEDPTVYTSVCLTVAEFLAKLQPTSDPAGVNHLQLFLIGLAGWINRNQQNAIEYLQEEVQVLREQLGKKPRFNDDQRRRLAAKARKIGLQRLKEIAAIVSPRTLLDWHQRLIARKYNGRAKRSPGRPSTPEEVRALILRMAAENRTWGYTRIQGALQNLGYAIGRGTIAKVLQAAGVDPAPDRQKRTTWKEFLRTLGRAGRGRLFQCGSVDGAGAGPLPRFLRNSIGHTGGSHRWNHPGTPGAVDEADGSQLDGRSGRVHEWLPLSHS